MAKVGSWKDAFISVNGTVLSDHANKISVESSADEVDLTGFTSAGFKEFDQGLKDGSITATFFADYAAGSVDSVLEPMFRLNTAGTIVVKPTSATVSSTNPTYTMVGKLFTYNPLAGAVGDALTIDCTFRHSGTLGVVKATA